MAKEIERKYLIDLQKWRELEKPPGHHYRQGYLVTDPQKTIRVRLTETKGFLTIKGISIGATRSEFEYEIPVMQAKELLDNFSISELSKIRYNIEFKNKIWEVDEFLGDNSGLFIAEIELKSEDDFFELPDWVTKEVTDEEKYYNSNLTINPYKNWDRQKTKLKYTYPDLIQRIYYQLSKGDDSNYHRVLADLRNGNREFEMEFDFKDRKIHWTCFEAGRYADVIEQDDNYIYFYLADTSRELEFVIPGHTYSDELKKPLLHRTPSMHYVWVIGPYFPGLQSVPDRPIKINLQSLGWDQSPLYKLNYWFKKMLLQYDARLTPIFEPIDYPNNGKHWQMIVPREKESRNK